MRLRVQDLEEKTTGKNLYSYQKGAIDQIFERFENSPDDYHLLYQLQLQGLR